MTEKEETNPKCHSISGPDLRQTENAAKLVVQISNVKPRELDQEVHWVYCIRPGASFMCLCLGNNWAFCVLTASTLDQHLFLCWTRVWSFMTVLAVYFMHVCIGLRPGWLALVVVGVFCVPALCWKLVGLCLYFVFLSCIGSGSRWFVGVCVKPSSCSTSAGRDTAYRGCTYCWKCM